MSSHTKTAVFCRSRSNSTLPRAPLRRDFVTTASFEAVCSCAGATTIQQSSNHPPHSFIIECYGWQVKQSFGRNDCLIAGLLYDSTNLSSSISFFYIWSPQQSKILTCQWHRRPNRPPRSRLNHPLRRASKSPRRHLKRSCRPGVVNHSTRNHGKTKRSHGRTSSSSKDM